MTEAYIKQLKNDKANILINPKTVADAVIDSDGKTTQDRIDEGVYIDEVVGESVPAEPWVTPDMVKWNQPRVDSVGDMGDTITTIRFENGIQMTFRTYSFYNHSITTAWGQMFYGPINDTIRIAPNDLPFARMPTVTVTPFGTVEGSGSFMVGAYNAIPGSTNVTYLPANTFTLTRATQANAVSGKLAVTAIGMWK